MTFDLVVRGGMVVDGSGAPRFRSDVAISGGRIAALGRVSERGRVELDADGRFVAPGFVDGHTHLDAQVFWDPLATSASWHGVTSVVMGNCGFTLAPCREAQADLVLRSLERAEDMHRTTLVEGVPWEWETFPQFLDAVERRPLGVNYAAYVGHSAVRVFAMGERAFADEASEDDLRAMEHAVEESLEAGAIGFSTSRLQHHRTRDGGPVPSLVATWDELRRMVQVLARKQTGIVEIANPMPDDAEGYAGYLRGLAELAAGSGRLLTFTCAFPADDRYRRGEQELGMLTDAGSAGAPMVGQVKTHELLAILGFEVSLPYDQLPGWRRVRSLPLAAQREVLLDPRRRAHLVEEATNGPYRRALGVEAPPPNYDLMRIYDAPDGRACLSVADVARARRVHPVDVVIDYSIETDLAGLFAQVVANEDLAQVVASIRHPNTVIAGADTGAHVTQVIDSSNPTFALANWVRRNEIFTWEEGVKLLSSDPARVWGLRGRGLVRVGYAADLVVFDPATVAPAMPTVAHDFPGGAPRLTQRAVGVDATIVNGELLLRDGDHTGACPGQLLRRGADTP